MPSSTSNFERELPSGGSGASLWIALALTSIALGGLEAFWRSRNHPASVAAVDESWVLAFGAIEPDSTVVVGTSRIQAALDPKVWAQLDGGDKPLILCLPGGSPLPILERLAADENFHGRVIFDFLPMFVFDASGASQERATQLLSAYDHARVSPSRWCDAWIAVHLEGACVFRTPQLLPLELVSAALKGRPIQPASATMDADRFGPVDYDRAGPLAKWDPVQGIAGIGYRVAETGGRPADAAETAEILARMERAFAQLESHGARTVAVWLPACGERANIEERRFPRAATWDVFAASTAIPTLCLADDPTFPRFDCFDGSHVDVADTARYTEVLHARLSAKFAAR